nr:conserved hypothetical protein [Serratia symbiotica]
MVEEKNMSDESKAKYPGGFDEIEIRQLLEGLVSAHISKAMSGEKMKSDDRIHDLGLIRPFIIHAAHLVRSLIEEKEGVWPIGINTEIEYRKLKGE